MLLDLLPSPPSSFGHLAETAEPVFYRLAIYLSVSLMDDPAMLAMLFC